MPPGSGKKERRKRRDLALGRVKACVAPHAIEDELVPVLLSTLRPPAALCGWDAPAVGPVHGGGGAGVTGLEQGSPEEQWRRAVEALCKTYSHLPVVLAMAGCRGLLEGAGGDVGESIAWLRFGLEALSGRDGGLTSDEVTTRATAARSAASLKRCHWLSGRWRCGRLPSADPSCAGGMGSPSE